MCRPSDEASLLCWLHRQIRQMDAWRDELFMDLREDDDPQLQKIAADRARFCREIDRLTAIAV